MRTSHVHIRMHTHAYAHVQHTCIHVHTHPAWRWPTFSTLQFQDRRMEQMSVNSYIWDVNNPNTPESNVIPASPLCCLEYNPKVSSSAAPAALGWICSDLSRLDLI